MRRRPLVLLCLIVVGILSVLQLAGVPPVPAPPGDAKACRLLSSPETVSITGTVTDPEVRDTYSSFILKHAVLTCRPVDLAISSVKITSSDTHPIPVGTVLTASGEAETILPPDNPGQFDAALWYRLKGVRYTMKNPSLRVLATGYNPLPEFIASLRRRFQSLVLRLWPEDVSGIMAAILTGNKSSLGEEERSLWQTAGLLHVLAISGLHLTLLGRGICLLLRKLRLPPKASAALSMGFMLFYTILIGMPISAVRATIMFLLMTGADLVGRTYDSPTAIALAALLILLENPWYLQYSGFQLSFTAVLSVSLLHERGKEVQVAELQLILLPLVLWNFFELPLYAALVNLVVLPLVPFILVSGIVGTAAGAVSSLCFPPALPAAASAASGPATPVLAWPGSFCIRLIHRLLDLVSRLPAASVICGRPSVPRILFYYALLALWSYALWKKRLSGRRLLLFALVPLLVFTLTFRPRTGLKIITQSVGQGDSILLECKDGRNILVDAGSSSVHEPGRNRILPCLKAEGIRRIDYLVLTHMDSDHVCGAREILSMIADRQTSLRIDAVLMPWLRERDEAWNQMAGLARSAGARVLAVSSGDCFPAGETIIRVLGPSPGDETVPVDTNSSCIVLSVSYRDFDALFTGDVSGAGERHLLEEAGRSGMCYEFLKVAHHGSAGSTPEQLLRVIRPEVGVISCGRGNRYGHPHEELIKRLEDAGVRIFRTDQQGAVTLTTDGSRYRIRTALPPSP